MTNEETNQPANLLRSEFSVYMDKQREARTRVYEAFDSVRAAIAISQTRDGAVALSAALPLLNQAISLIDSAH